jgi:glycyl-tRNA synthetase beta subunit
MGDRLVTDIGGFEAGEVPKEEHTPLFWQRQLMAVFNLLWREKRILNLDEFRRKMEEMSPADYARWAFYTRRLEGVIGLLEEKGVLRAADVEARTQQILRKGRDGGAG